MPSACISELACCLLPQAACTRQFARAKSSRCRPCLEEEEEEEEEEQQQQQQEEEEVQQQ
jgi:hypothetical protein